MNKKKNRIIAGIILIILLSVGFWYVRIFSAGALTEIHRNVLIIAEMAGNSLNGEMLKKVKVAPEDENTVPYESIKNRLIGLHNTDNTIRFAYLYTQREGKLFFIADSEPQTSKDYSPPGQEYSEAPHQYFQPFIDGKSIVTEPVSDRWGEWVSVLVPLKNDSGTVVAVFGMDYPVETWNKNIRQHTIQSSALVLLATIIYIVGFIVFENNLRVRENERNFRFFFDLTEDMIVVGSRSGKILHSNDKIRQRLGYTEKEILDLNLVSLRPTELQREAEAVFKKVLEGKEKKCTLPMRKKDGSPLASETEVTFGKWNGEDCVYCVTKDMSNEKQILDKFSKIFDANPTLMAISSYPDRVFTDVNQTFADKTGYEKNELLGKTPLQVGLYKNKEAIQEIGKILSQQGYVKNFDIEIKKKNGEILSGIYYADIVKDHGKEYLLIVIVDQSDRVEAEESLKKTLEDSERLNKLMVGRELEMIELKKENARLRVGISKKGNDNKK